MQKAGIRLELKLVTELGLEVPLTERRETERTVKQGGECSVSLCALSDPRELRTRCCGRLVISEGYQVTAGKERPVAALQPKEGDFEHELPDSPGFIERRP